MTYITVVDKKVWIELFAINLPCVPFSKSLPCEKVQETTDSRIKCLSVNSLSQFPQKIKKNIEEL